MWRKIGEIVASLVAMAVVVAYLCYASMLTKEVRKELCVKEIAISFDNGSEKHRFATVADIRKQLSHGGFDVKGKVVDGVNLWQIAQLLAKNSYVKDVDVYATCSGTLYIDIEQHTPVMRLLSGGYNCYITAEGEVFRSPDGAACHTPVVTGSFRPLFRQNFEGSITDYYAKLIAAEDMEVAALNKDISKSKQEYRACAERLKQLKDDGRRKIFESEDSYQHRLAGIEQERKTTIQKSLKLRAEREQLQKKKQRVLKDKAKLINGRNDLLCLIDFVGRIREDSYWGGEITQFDIRTNSYGEISLRLLPRSGDFMVEFGTLTDRDSKLAKLQKFYDEGLSHIGLGYYKTIDVRYDKQVICTK
jgi:hypothetical protein